MKLLITRKIDSEAVALLNKYFTIKYFDKNIPMSKEILKAEIADYDAVLCCVSEKIDKEIIKIGLPKLKVISNMAIGLDNIDVEFALSNNVAVYNLSNIVTDATADMTLAMYLSMNRKINSAYNYVKSGKWNAWDPEIFCGRTLKNLTWGIIGLGNIGKAVSKRCLSFGTNLIYYDPYVDETQLNGIKIYKKTLLKELIKESDVISIHVPLNKSTYNLINYNNLSLMKRNAVLINMARGGIVNSNDLYKILSTRMIAGAALDVFHPEPIDKKNNILNLNNVLITPHIGTATVDCRKDMAIGAAKNIIKHYEEHNYEI